MEMSGIEMYLVGLKGNHFIDLYIWTEYKDGHETRYSTTLN